MTEPTRHRPPGQADFKPWDFLFTRWRLILIPAVIAAVLASILSAGGSTKYEAQAKLLVGGPSIEQAAFFKKAFPAEAIARDPISNLELGSLDVVARATSDELGGDVTMSEVEDAVTLAPEGSSNVVAITAVDSEPSQASAIANAFANAYIDFLRDSDRARLERAREMVKSDFDVMSPSEQAGPEGRILKEQITRLIGLRALQTGNAEVVEPANATTSVSSSSPVRRAALAGFLGLLVGAGLALLSDRLDRRIKGPGAVVDVFDAPLLAEVRREGLGGLERSSSGDQSEPAEAYRLLRGRLRHSSAGEDARSILIAGPADGDDGAAVATELALAYAETGAKALLVECALRNPSLAEALGLTQSPGLADYLSGEVELDAVVQHHSVKASRWLDVIVAGASAAAGSPGELLESPRLATLLDAVSSVYDIVVVTAPPITLVADAIPVVKRVSSVVVVARVGATTGDQLERLKGQLDDLDADVLGVVATGVRSGRLFG